ncbi:MAG: DUF5615 family PIN-like protein [candidate division KSB1 bacterium]|nr:DUF5615 family PIN-like protein [candidate division KSB1 bacterium]MDZ7312698.1 DUF5615 family PIN-like protein [candidate division KSB1 bacterium]
MTKITLYLDADVRARLAKILRERGFDVICALEVGLQDAADEVQLDFAISQQRVLLTHNIGDFVTLDRTYRRRGKKHFGILVSNQIPLAELIRRVHKFLNTQTREEMEDRFEWLENYR